MKLLVLSLICFSITGSAIGEEKSAFLSYNRSLKEKLFYIPREAGDGRLGLPKKVMDRLHELSQLNGAIQGNSGAGVYNREALEKAQARKAALFGPKADEEAAALAEKAYKLYRMDVRAIRGGVEQPPQSHLDLEGDVEKLTKKFEKSTSARRAASKAGLGRLGKAAVVAVPAAAAAAVIGSGSEAQAGAVMDSDLPAHELNHDEVRQQQDIEVLDAK